MADLGNLWFSLGLDDSKFEKEWKAALKKYESTAKVNIDFKISDQAIKELEKFKNAGYTVKEAKSYAQLAKAVMQVGIEQEKYNQALAKTKALNDKNANQNAESQARINNRNAESLERQAAIRARVNNLERQSVTTNRQLSTHYRDQALWVQNLMTFASNYFSLYAVKNFATELATVSGEFEKQRVTLQAMVGEMEGLEIYGKMKELAVVSPFEFKDLSAYAKQLAAFSVPYEELYDTTKRLADVSAGLGVDMSRIILAYGQIRSAGILKGTELRQLTEAGVPILEKLADKFTELEGKAVSIGDVFGKISQKMVSFEMVKDIFTDLTSEGGKFYNMQEIQAETLAGKISNLKDAYAIMLSEMGESVGDYLKDGVDILYRLIDNWKVLGSVILSAATAFSTYQLAQVAAFTSSKLQLVGKFVTIFTRLEGSIIKTVRAMSMLKIASKAGTWGAVLAVFAGLATAFLSARSAAKSFNNELSKMVNSKALDFSNEVSALEDLTRAIEATTEGTENRRLAVDAYNQRFGQYLQNLYDEKTALDTIKQGHDEVRQAMSDRYKEEAVLQAKMKVKDEYGGKLKEIEAEFYKSLKGQGLGGYYRSALDAIKDLIMSDAFPEDSVERVNALYEKMWSIFKSEPGTDIAASFVDYFKDYTSQFQDYTSALKDALQEVDDAFDTSVYDSYKKQLEFERLTKEHTKKLKEIRDSNKPGTKGLSEAEHNEEVRYIKELINLYQGVPKELKKWKDALKNITDETETWQEKAQKIFVKHKAATGFAPQANDTYLSYLAKMRKDYKGIIDSLKDLEKYDPDNDMPGMKARRDAYEELAKLWGIPLDEKADNKAQQELLKKQREEVEKLKTQYNSLLAVYKAFINLRNKTGDEGIAGRAVATQFKDYEDDLLTALSGGGIEEYFTKTFTKISDEALAKGGDFGKNFVEGMKSTLSTLGTKDVVDAIGIGKELVDKLKSWGMEDFMLQGSGVSLDISKILKAQAEADSKALAKAQEVQDMINKASTASESEKAAMREVIINDIAEKEMLSDEQVAELKKKNIDDIFAYAIERANELAQLEGENNKKVAQEKINDLGKAYAKEMIEDTIGQGAMENLSEKTYSELKALQTELTGLLDKEFQPSEELKEQLQAAGIELDKFIEAYKEYLKLQGKEVNSATGKQLRKNLEAAANSVLEIVEPLKQLSDSNFMSGFLDSLGLGVNIAKDISAAFKAREENGGKFGLEGMTSLFAVAAKVIGAVVNGIAAAKQYREEMERAATAFSRGVVENARELDIVGEKFNTIFGENLIGALDADNNALRRLNSELKNSSRTVADMKVMTKKGFWGIGRQYTSLSDLAPQLFKADGSVNYEYLDEFLDAYGDKMSESQKSLLEHLKTTYEQYQDAMEDTSEYLSNIFSDTASTIADRMMEAFAATGDAATGLGDLVHGIAKQMAKDLIQSLLVEQYLTPAIDRIKALYDPNKAEFEADSVIRTQKTILVMQDAIQAVGESVPEVNKLLEAIQAMGIDLSADAENASEVLSGLTEDQQNLLMSYINGIRADVSFNKGMFLSVVNSVGEINNNIATAIVVWKQIEANTHRSADGVDRIIGFFESVMGPYDGGGGQAFRVNIA